MMGSKKALSAEKGPFYNDESKMETTQKTPDSSHADAR
jgi:hypothetical protein